MFSKTPRLFETSVAVLHINASARGTMCQGFEAVPKAA